MMKLNALFLTFGMLAAITAFAAESPPSGNRKATLAWQEEQTAAKYEVQLSANRKFSRVLQKQVVEEPRWTVELGAGTYYFRVRPIDAENLPGPWSDIEGFVVNPHGPELTAPPENTILSEKLMDKTVKLQWSAGLQGTQSVIEIKDAQGPVLKRTVDGNSFAWKPQESGSYQWRAGYASIAGTEWSAYRNLQIQPEALGIVAPVVAPPKPEASTRLCQNTSLLGFRIAGIGIRQDSDGQSGSGFVSWNPRCSVSPFLDLSLSLGGSMLKGPGDRAGQTKNFALLEYMGWATTSPSGGSGLSFGIGAGAQTWVNFGTYSQIGARFGYRTGWLRWAFVEELFLEYGYLFATDKAHEGKVGVMMRWGRP